MGPKRALSGMGRKRTLKGMGPKRVLEGMGPKRGLKEMGPKRALNPKPRELSGDPPLGQVANENLPYIYLHTSLQTIA